MPSTPTRKDITHDRILDIAADAIRGTGFQGMGLADIMKQAGLTHGGFYAHFASRDALLAEALERAGRQSREHLQASVAERQARGASALRALVDAYLSDRHLAAVDSGCPVAALVSEMPRQAPEVRAAAAASVKSLLASVAQALPAGQADAAPAVAGQLVGTLQLARTLGDNRAGRALLAAARRDLLARYDAPSSPRR